MLLATSRTNKAQPTKRRVVVEKFLLCNYSNTVRAFPQNFLIMTRSSARPSWHLDMDSGLPLKVALMVAEVHHTNHKAKWGSKPVMITALNEALRGIEQ